VNPARRVAAILVVILALAMQPTAQEDIVKVKIPLIMLSYNHQADLHEHDNTGMNYWMNSKILVHPAHPEWAFNIVSPARYGDPKSILEFSTNFAYLEDMADQGKAALEFLRSLGEAKLCFSLEVRDFKVNEPLRFDVECWPESQMSGPTGWVGYRHIVLPPGDYGDVCFVFKIDVDFTGIRETVEEPVTVSDVTFYPTTHAFQLQVISCNYRKGVPMDYDGSFHLLTIWLEDEVPAGMLPLVQEYTCDGWQAVSELRDRSYNPYVVIPDDEGHSVDIVVNRDTMDYEYAYWSFIENDSKVNVTWLRSHNAAEVYHRRGPRPFMLKLLNHSEGWSSKMPWYEAFRWPRQTYNVTVVLGGSLGNPEAKEWESRAGIEWSLDPYRGVLTLRLPDGRTFKSDLEKSGPGVEGIALFMAFLDDDGRLVVLVEGDTRWGTKALADYLLELESGLGFGSVYGGVPTSLSYTVSLEYRGLLPYILVLEYHDADGNYEYGLLEVSVLWEQVGGGG